MLIYLLRHAEAEPYQEDDFSRRLTPKGKTQAGRVGEFLVHQKIIPDLLLTSPVLRAKETAEIVTEKLGKIDLTEVSWLACGMSPEEAMKELGAYVAFESIMIVGHEPDFSALVANLIGLRTGASINLSKASLTGIDLARLTPGCGVLKFFTPVKFV
jgi:phosphohistidine phosphatase